MSDLTNATSPSGENSLSNTDAINTLPINFHGKGSEYFGIWIVNILLTIITLGIYSAWAKVRNKQYFYGNTEIDGATFTYTAKPISILIGRVIAVILLGGYTLATHTYPTMAGLFLLVIFALFPWLLVRSQRFNARNSVYRGIRFGFEGSVWGAYSAYMLWPLLTILTFGLLGPKAMQVQYRYLVNGHRYGTSSFEFGAGALPFYKIFGVLLLLVFIMMGVILATLGTTMADLSAGTVSPGTQIFSTLLILPFYLFGFIYFTVATKNLLYNSSVINNAGFAANLKVGSYCLLFVTNTILTVITLGLFIPFAKVRTARYIADHMNIKVQGTLENYVQDENKKIDAFGEEFGEVFDMDFGL